MDCLEFQTLWQKSDVTSCLGGCLALFDISPLLWLGLKWMFQRKRPQFGLFSTVSFLLSFNVFWFPQRMQSHIGCICLTYFSTLSWVKQWMHFREVDRSSAGAQVLLADVAWTSWQQSWTNNTSDGSNISLSPSARWSTPVPPQVLLKINLILNQELFTQSSRQGMEKIKIKFC